MRGLSRFVLTESGTLVDKASFLDGKLFVFDFDSGEWRETRDFSLGELMIARPLSKEEVEYLVKSGRSD